MGSVDFSKVPGWVARVEAAANRALTRTGIAGAASVKRHFTKMPFGKWQSAPPGFPPNVRSGVLRNSITSTPSTALNTAIGTNVKYGKVQELGGIITAKGKALVIPLNPAAQRISEISGGHPTRGIVVRRIRTRKGTTLLVGTNKRLVNIGYGSRRLRLNNEPVWVLKRAVKIKPHPYLRPVLSRDWPEMKAVFHASFRAGMRGGGAAK